MQTRLSCKEDGVDHGELLRDVGLMKKELLK
jgi:hypothetical protein